MKLIEPKHVTIGNVEYSIFPFPAFYAANLSGELIRFLAPIVTGIAPLLGGKTKDGGTILDMDVKDIMPMIIPAVQTIDGNTLETLLKKLFINQQNVSCRYKDENGHTVEGYLTGDLADEIFCQNIDEMYQLAFEVISVNYKGFFSNLLDQFGNQNETITMSMSRSTEN